MKIERYILKWFWFANSSILIEKFGIERSDLRLYPSNFTIKYNPLPSQRDTSHWLEYTATSGNSLKYGIVPNEYP